MDISWKGNLILWLNRIEIPLFWCKKIISFRTIWIYGNKEKNKNIILLFSFSESFR